MSDNFEHISVIGLGYVGLPTAAIIATNGIRVTGIDTNLKTVETINRGKAPIVEPDLDELIERAVTAGSLKARSTPEAADAFIIAVPTPLVGEREPDLKYLRKAAEDLAPVLEKGNLIILESTSPVGTTRNLAEWLSKMRSDLSFPDSKLDDPDINIAYSPERVLPGRILIELMANDRVIGGLTPTCSRRAVSMYKRFVNGECLITDAKTAELVKLAENAYRDTNIAFANELSLICEAVGVDVWEAVELANRHPRVNILRPGPGVGGHCIAVDPWFIVNSVPDKTELIQAARRVNDGKPLHIARNVALALKADDTRPIVCLGLAYKADIDDLRESPAIDVVAELAKLTSRQILIVEPHIDVLPTELEDIDQLKLSELAAALQEAGTVVLLTDHSAFKDIDATQLTGKKIFDTRGYWPKSMFEILDEPEK
ncbi:MAG: UDP-N-acetyl-D-mannosamine dehydrogenase [Rhodospirillales bacterium]|nr:UDP-N-acetyl-D-mannosamine dehydrogenase [Rhodospirillales bacterium]